MAEEIVGISELIQSAEKFLGDVGALRESSSKILRIDKSVTRTRELLYDSSGFGFSFRSGFDSEITIHVDRQDESVNEIDAARGNLYPSHFSRLYITVPAGRTGILEMRIKRTPAFLDGFIISSGEEEPGSTADSVQLLTSDVTVSALPYTGAETFNIPGLIGGSIVFEMVTAGGSSPVINFQLVRPDAVIMAGGPMIILPPHPFSIVAGRETGVNIHPGTQSGSGMSATVFVESQILTGPFQVYLSLSSGSFTSGTFNAVLYPVYSK